MGRNSYSIDFKLKAVRRLNADFEGNISKASRNMGIDRKQLIEWSKKEVKLANVPDKIRRYVAGGRGAKFPLLEEQLFAWFKDQRQSKNMYFIIVNFV